MTTTNKLRIVIANISSSLDGRVTGPVFSGMI